MLLEHEIEVASVTTIELIHPWSYTAKEEIYIIEIVSKQSL